MVSLLQAHMQTWGACACGDMVLSGRWDKNTDVHEV
jgi:hypothetical protein